jgi:Cys-tRNA(Pro)/Cys-tRNA(Cys) deacylase
VPHRVLTFPHDPGAPAYGLEAASALGIPAARVFKTLVARLDGAPAGTGGRASPLAVALVPADRQLDLRALAAVLGARRAELAPVADAERATGYVVGGISPLAQRRALPTVIDASALDHPEILVSAGRRGVELALAPADLVRLTGARVAPVARP